MNTGNEKLLDRVRNLLDMANDAGSPHEAAIAAKRARSIMDKHQLSLIDIVDSEPSDFGEAGTVEGRRIARWKQSLAIKVATYNDCLVARTSDQLVFKGFSADADAALMLYHYLVKVGNRLARDNGRGAHAFKVGYTQVLCERLKAMTRERETTTTAGTDLVVVKAQQVALEFGQARYAECTTTHRSNPTAYAARQSAGRKVSIGNSLNGSAAQSRLN